MNKFSLFLVNNSVGLNVLKFYPSYKVQYVIVCTLAFLSGIGQKFKSSSNNNQIYNM